jgi:hypothetical protein
MKITCHYRNDPERGLTDPVLEKDGRRFVFRLYSGDWLDPIWPLVGNSWFSPPFPTKVLHRFVTLPLLPFVAWKWPFMDKAGYLGFKLYGVDNAVYAQWLTTADQIYNGSQAVCLSFRPFASIK